MANDPRLRGVKRAIEAARNQLRVEYKKRPARAKTIHRKFLKLREAYKHLGLKERNRQLANITPPPGRPPGKPPYGKRGRSKGR